MCWPKLKQKLLKDSDLPETLSAPAIRALDREGIRSLAQLAGQTEARVAGLHGMGPKGVAILRTAMKKSGFSFKKKTR